MPLAGAWYYQDGTMCTSSTACTTTIPTWIPNITSSCSGGGGGGGGSATTTVTIVGGTSSTNTTSMHSLWMEQQWAEQQRIIHHPPQPTDQELYQRAIAEHNIQEAERLRNQIDNRERLQQERMRVQKQKDDERELARKRAHEFLLEYLTKPQQETFKKNGWFVVEGGRTKTKYRIRSNSLAGNIDVYKDDKITHRLCGHVQTNRVPIGDQLLAQKMMLESSEDDFLRIANRHVVY